MPPTAASLARSLRRLGPGRTDPGPYVVGDRITSHRDPAFGSLPLRPSPAMPTIPAPLGRGRVFANQPGAWKGPAPISQDPASVAQGGALSSPRTPPTFHESKGWYSVALPLPPGTDIYATGMVAGPLRRNGRTISLWTTDAFSYTDTTEALYQVHPWAIGVRANGSAFGLLADSPRRGIISAGRRDLLMAFEGEPFAVYLIERDHPAEVVRALANLTGLPPLPPLWALGYHQCRWSYEPDSRVRQIATEFRTRQIPCDVLWLDIDSMHGFRVFSFDADKFPDPAALNADLHADGFKTVWMIDPGIKVDAADPVYQSGHKGDHFITDASGNEYHGSVWPGPCAFPDFTRQRTRNWWAGLYRDYLAHGIDGIWNDMNEPSVFDAPGKTMPATNRHDADDTLGGPDTHARYHNTYGMMMARATREGIEAARPDTRPFLLTRSNFLGGHRYAATWTGDNASTWKHLHWSIPMALNLGLSGQPFVGPDIGGFAGEADGHLFARWMGIGALLPFARGHTIKGSADHEPWAFGPGCERICRLALERRYRLLPYFYTLFREASQTGMPVVRPLFVADPTDPKLRDAEDSFLLGSDVLVRARTSFTGMCRAAMPAGRWAAFEPAGSMAGEMPTPLGSLADRELPELFIREGAIVPLGPAMQHINEKPLDPLTLIVHPDASGCASGVLYEDEGEGIEYEHGAYRLTSFESRRSDEGVTIEQRVIQGKWHPAERETRVVVVSEP